MEGLLTNLGSGEVWWSLCLFKVVDEINPYQLGISVWFFTDCAMVNSSIFHHLGEYLLIHFFPPHRGSPQIPDTKGDIFPLESKRDVNHNWLSCNKDNYEKKSGVHEWTGDLKERNMGSKRSDAWKTLISKESLFWSLWGTPPFTIDLGLEMHSF